MFKYRVSSTDELVTFCNRPPCSREVSAEKKVIAIISNAVQSVFFTLIRRFIYLFQPVMLSLKCRAYLCIIGVPLSVQAHSQLPVEAQNKHSRENSPRLVEG